MATTTELNDRVAKAIAAHLGKAPKAPTTYVDEPAPAPKTPTVLEHGHVWFSDVFGYKPKFGDFGVRVLDTAVDADIARLIPKVDPDYVLQRDEAALLVAGMMDGDKTLITGPTGSGKSSLVKYVCAKLNRPFIRINMSGDVESASLFGTLVVRGGAETLGDLGAGGIVLRFAHRACSDTVCDCQ
jgi:predicted AAA+ superfamily ATPase